MTFDEALAEMRGHEEAKRSQESYLKKIHDDVEEICKDTMGDEFRSWRRVETMIRARSKISDVHEDHIRDLLREM